MEDIDQAEVARAETQPVIIEKDVPLQAENDSGIHPDFDYENPDHPNNRPAIAAGQTMAAGSLPLGVLKQFEQDAGKLVTTLEESFHVSRGPIVTRDSLKVSPVVEGVTEPISGSLEAPMGTDRRYGQDMPPATETDEQRQARWDARNAA